MNWSGWTIEGRSHSDAGGKSIVLDTNATSQLRNQGSASTNDSPKFQHEIHISVVKAIYTRTEFIATASGDEDFGLVLESTSFYAEQGGQVMHFLELLSFLHNRNVVVLHPELPLPVIRRTDAMINRKQRKFI